MECADDPLHLTASIIQIILIIINNQNQMKERFQPEIRFSNMEQQMDSSISTPWMGTNTKEIVNPILRFHNELIDFAEYVSPPEEEHNSKTLVFKSIEQTATKFMPECQVTNPLFSNKIYLKGTELQIFIITRTNPAEWHQVGKKILEESGLHSYSMSSQDIQTSGELRIICQHLETETQVWLTFVPQSWEVYLKEINETILGVAELRYLFLINWCMVRQRNFHTSIKSLLIFGICNFFMFERRKQRSRTLAEGIIKFLEFFGVGSAHERQIKYHEGKAFHCLINSEQKNFYFQIAENVNISSNSVRDYFKVIQNRYRVVGNFFYVPGSSIVAHLVNPCLGEFFY